MGKRGLVRKGRTFELRQLECFCAVARAGSFTRAAVELGMQKLCGACDAPRIWT